MVFLGHLVQRKTLKRNMREMVELGLSAKQQKAYKLQQIKKEVHEMIKSRVSVLKSKGHDQLNDSADDFQNVISTDERRALTGRYSMDVALEEKLCDLYDLYVEGMDEEKGPLSRKLYVEFAELWPAGYMDNLGIKDAIYRAKKRRQHKLQVRNKERIERKKLASKVKLQEPTLIAQTQAGQERHMVPTFRVPRPQDKPISSLSPSIQNKLNDPTPFRSDTYGSKHHEKARRISADIISDVGSKIISTDMRKKMKMQAPPEKVKHYNGTSLSLQQSKPSTQMPASATSVQPS
ncbi:ubinuclein-1 [Dendrobium catenatum]|uniref:ubinuclein-1 n=1 Tax=Dendrobium catenatum TaxID=906689 RepID=UPI0010A01E17|nr:ubinuclein-1 [Dendrobium catenatum]